MNCSAIMCSLNFDFWKMVAALVGIFAAYTAYQQHLTAKSKLRLDLFEKRFSVFAGTRRFLSQILQQGTATYEHLVAFRAATVEAPFLFKSDLVEYLEEVDRRALLENTLRLKYAELPVGDERAQLVQQAHDEIAWLTGQIRELKTRFGPYFSFSEDGAI